MAGILRGRCTQFNHQYFLEMSGKEKSEEHRQEHSGKKNNMSKQVEKVVQDSEVQEREKLQEELKSFEQKSNELQEELRAFEEKSQSLHDKYLRLSAEFDNYRKRTLKEKTELIKTASEDLIKRFIPFVDDIERGLNAVNTSQDIEALKEGMNLIYSRLKDFLMQNGIKEIEALDQEFNTDIHEAVTKIPAPEESKKGKVVDVIEKGYMLHDKVIRYPKVVVGE